MEPYYYSKMNKVQQAAYHAIRQGLLEISDSIQIPGMEAEELYNVFFRLRLDHPEIFWATGYKYKYYPDSPNFIFIPEYLFDKNKIKEHQKALKSRVEKLVRPVKDKSEWEKEKYVHDFICENVHYDKLKKSYSHEIIGPLGQGVGVCEGIAKSVKVLCDALGIWCMIAVCGNNPEKGIKYRHTWNIVRIGGNYYHLDATFDNTLGNDKKEIRYDYFNLDDKSIFRDHEPLIAPAPKGIVIKLLLDAYFHTKSGLLLRAVGDNATLVTTLAKDRGTVKILGLVISNALVAFGGCIVCHETRSFSATMGTGQLVYGLAAVIIGVSIIHFYTGTRLARGLRKSGPLRFLGSPQGTTAVVLGSVLYKLCIQVAMSLGLPTNMMKLITAALFLLVLVLSGRKGEAIIHA